MFHMLATILFDLWRPLGCFAVRMHGRRKMKVLYFHWCLAQSLHHLSKSTLLSVPANGFVVGGPQAASVVLLMPHAIYAAEEFNLQQAPTPSFSLSRTCDPSSDIIYHSWRILSMEWSISSPRRAYWWIRICFLKLCSSLLRPMTLDALKINMTYEGKFWTL